ncbi:MAG TPA: hypothetical protein VFH31_17370 [Pyrinomonadaceae bacterium]|nr:hypothetical protein [Pyrinomonadaceae bacterium]
MKKINCVLWILMLLFGNASNVWACMCSGHARLLQWELSQGKIDPRYRDWLKYYPGIVFVGRVMQKKKVNMKVFSSDWYNYRITFKVERYWKGTDTSELEGYWKETNTEIVLFTGIGGGDCGFPFRKRESYIVFAKALDGRLQTNICSLTRGARYAPNVINGLYLGEGKVPTESTVGVNRKIQAGFSAQDDENWPSLSYLRNDYKSVSVVVHVVIRQAEITGRIGGYENWRVEAEVLESFKGKFRKGDLIMYFLGAEAGLKKEYLTGEKIVFLLSEYDKEKKALRYSVLENSTLAHTKDRVRKLRRIKKSYAKTQPRRG